MRPHLFRWGNRDLTDLAAAEIGASMRPHLFRWGNPRKKPLHTRTFTTLQ